MMEHIHLVPSDDEDLYSGYNEYPSALNTKSLENDDIIKEALRSSIGRRPPISLKPTTASRLGTSSGFRGGTSMRPYTGSVDGVNRPMTAVRGAGYTSNRVGSGSSQMFDPLNQAASGPAPPLESKKEDTPEEKIKKAERRIMELIEESCFANKSGDMRLALERAKEASSKERSLIRIQDQSGLSDTHNLDLTFSVLFNLANQYAANEMFSEALNTYQVITKNRTFNNASRLKLNMGNIYLKLSDYDKALKMYRMALDQVPTTHKELRIKIMHNIGVLFVKMSQFTEACSSFEFIMQEKADFHTGLDLIVCYYALGEREKMKRGFQALVEVPLNIDDEDKYSATSDDPALNLALEAIRNDSLRQLERQMKQNAERSILTAARLIAPVIDDTFAVGYSWCLETLKASSYAFLAAELEINKAVMFLKQKEISQAIETLKAFEKKTESKIVSSAATNLAFIYFLQGDIEQARKFSESSRTADGYNAAAFVNLGCCSMAAGDIEKAKDLFLCSLENDASCVEALYNLGLANKQLGLHEDALDCFLKLQAIVRHHPEALYQLGHLYQLLGDVDQAVEWHVFLRITEQKLVDENLFSTHVFLFFRFLQLLGIVPTDPGILQKLGEIFESDNDKQQAYHYHFESYRYYPSNFDVIDWLGSYFIELQVAERAISFFEKASVIQPDEMKWKLLIASCHRRAGNYQQALATYKDIHRESPENIECLKFLVRLSSDMGLKEAADYNLELKKAEKAKELRSRVGSGRPGSMRSIGSAQSSRAGSGSGGAVPMSHPGSGNVQDFPRGTTPITEEQYSRKTGRDLDASYSDPLGPAIERPRTSAGPRQVADDDFGDDDLGDDLLPE
ncbi:Intraflagellar transport protein 88-like protein [Frankliniella fusca]|uniref:Intraflagellar transport protein 88-like protein n=1 Tax=Frankliniella fusca TaxID=407009 RepID=A0AAE1H413_9NEOP|nr:Intraflagellar transport protein 88-like protein [Frankliniella fusca]